ncbi:UNVERIFIED_CONTAM: hypothetical protein DES50_102772 [Williamsia faeni]
MAKYRAIVTKEDRWWLIRIPALDGVNGNLTGLTQARKLSDITIEAQNYACTVLDVAPSEIELEFNIQLDDIDVSQKIDQVKTHRRCAAEYEQKSLAEARELAKTLASKGVSVRDIGTALDVSFQRAQQLVTS